MNDSSGFYGRSRRVGPMGRFAVGLGAVTGNEPVTVAQAKARLRIDTTDDDAALTAAISAARELVEAETGRAIVQAGYTLWLDTFPLRSNGEGGEILLPRPPLVSVGLVSYYDANGNVQIYSPSNYFVTAGAEPGRILPKSAVPWPVTQYGRPEAVQIQYTAGYDTAPAAAVEAVLIILADRWQQPEGAAGIPPAARRLLDTLEVGQVW